MIALRAALCRRIDFLHSVPFLHGDNGLMRRLMANPGGFRLVDPRVVLIGSCAGAVHQNSPAIDLIVKNDLYCGVSPKLGRFAAIFAVGLAPIDTGGYDALPVERSGDFPVGCTRQPHIVDPAHNTSSVFIHHQLVLVPDALAIAVGRISGNILPADLFIEKDGFDLIAQIPQMVVIHQTAEVKHIGAVALAVQAVQHRHKAAPQGGEHSVTNMDKTTKTMERSC